MSEERLLNALGQVDDQYILEAAPGQTPGKNRAWIKWAALAACLCLVLAAIRIVYRSEPNTAPYEGPEYEVLVFGYSDSAGAADLEAEYLFADYEKYSSVQPQSQVTLQIRNKTYIGYYQNTQYRSYHYYPVYEYFDSENNVFTIDHTGKLVSFFWGKSTADGKKLSQADCLQIAMDFLKEIVDISSYEVEITEDSVSECYVAEFTKYAGNLKTADSATVTVQYNGDIYSYASFMLDKVPADTKVDDIEPAAVTASINKRLDKIYADAKTKYDRIEYSEPSVLLSITKDGNRCLVCYVDVRCINTAGQFEAVVSESINLVLFLP